MFYVHVLKSENNWRFYVGMTSNISKRVNEHNKAYTKSTKGYLPWQLFFYEEYKTRTEARARGIYLKSGVGKEYIKNKWTSSSVG